VCPCLHLAVPCRGKHNRQNPYVDEFSKRSKTRSSHIASSKNSHFPHKLGVPFLSFFEQHGSLRIFIIPCSLVLHANYPIRPPPTTPLPPRSRLPPSTTSLPLISTPHASPCGFPNAKRRSLRRKPMPPPLPLLPSRTHPALSSWFAAVIPPGEGFPC